MIDSLSDLQEGDHLLALSSGCGVTHLTRISGPLGLRLMVGMETVGEREARRKESCAPERIMWRHQPSSKSRVIMFIFNSG